LIIFKEKTKSKQRTLFNKHLFDLQYAIEYEMDQVMEPQDLLRGNPVFIKLVVQYTRGAKERQFLRDLLQPLIKDVLEQNDLDLDVDPLNVSFFFNLNEVCEKTKTKQKTRLTLLALSRSTGT